MDDKANTEIWWSTCGHSRNFASTMWFFSNDRKVRFWNFDARPWLLKWRHFLVSGNPLDVYGIQVEESFAHGSYEGILSYWSSKYIQILNIPGKFLFNVDCVSGPVPKHPQGILGASQATAVPMRAQPERQWTHLQLCANANCKWSGKEHRCEREEDMTFLSVLLTIRRVEYWMIIALLHPWHLS